MAGCLGLTKFMLKELDSDVRKTKQMEDDKENRLNRDTDAKRLLRIYLMMMIMTQTLLALKKLKKKWFARVSKEPLEDA